MQLTAPGDVHWSQILSGNMPYWFLKNDFQVLQYIFKGNRLEDTRGSPLRDIWWDYIQLCCSEGPERRPGMNEARRKIEELRHTEQAGAEVTVMELHRYIAVHA